MSYFVIPMAGLSSRFFNAGYLIPKYQLYIKSTTMFLWSVESFKKYFNTDKFLFICRNVYETPAFIKNEISKISLNSYSVLVLEKETLGQADTVYQGLAMMNLLNSDEDVYIFNIDSRIEFFEKPEYAENGEVDGYLEVFKSDGEHWSFVEPGANCSVLRTTEKIRISELCSDGLYYFKRISDFAMIFEEMRRARQFNHNELYIAPMYNSMIKNSSMNVKYRLVPRSKVIICGTPDEYRSMAKYYELTEKDNQSKLEIKATK